jgi:ketosteroid isomerase-like protein
MTNKQKLQKMFEEFNNPDKQAGLMNILAMMSDDIVWTTSGPPDIIPFSGEYKGKSGVANMFATEAKVLQPADFLDTPQFIGADNDANQVFYVPLESVKLQAPPNNEYRTGFAMVFTFNDEGLITRAASIFDTYAVAKAFNP